jgi:catechol 2,3-dioxygenase-like lactoylglutathione lyase family enzyme
MAQVRYIVADVDRAVGFYTAHLGFELVRQFGPAMAIVTRGDLELWLAGPTASAARPMPDGARPTPGGWNRIVVTVENLEAFVGRLAASGVRFRNDILAGPGGRQVLCMDPSGNLVELFEPAPRDA